MDALFAKGAQEANFDKRLAIYKEVQALLVEDMPIFWLTDASPIFLHHKDLRFPSYGYGEFWDEVYWKTAQ